MINNDIRHTWFLEHAPEVVWEFLTNSEKLSQWLMQNDFKPVIGHKFRFTTKAQPAFGFDGIIRCEVLELIPNKKLSYSWRGGPSEDKTTLDSLVTWTLQPKNNGTELLLEHTGFKGMKNYMVYMYMNEGWGNKIKSRFIELVNKTMNEGSNH